ncbi:ABC transporter permease [Ningiella sp. W23]|uniref:ABC transporter permease n=1 Tax=Ningiella sp. W23 TaxID=3023715 RepID=UPI003757A6CB
MLLSALIVLPLLVVASSVFVFDTELWAHVFATVLSDYVINSIVLAASVGIGTIIVGTYLAYIMVNFEFVGKSMLTWLILLPLAMPAYIIAYTYTGILDFSGPLQSFLRDTFEWTRADYQFWDVRSLSGAIAMMILVFYPYVYILARTAFAEQSYSLYKVSQLAGLSRLAHLRKVAFPLARPAIVTGASLAMMEAFADYGTVAYFGVSTFSTGIFRTWFGMGNVQGAAQLASLLCLFVLVLLILEKRGRRDAAHYVNVSGSANAAKHVHKVSSFKGLALFVLCLLPAALGFIIPFIQLAIWSIQFADVGDLGAFTDLVVNTFYLAFLGALIIVAIALLVSYAKRMLPNKINQTAEQMLSLGYALPGIVIAVGVLMVAGFFDRQLNAFTMLVFDYRPGLVVSGGVAILIFAYAVRFVSVALQNTETGLARISPKMDSAALSMDGRSERLLRRIHVPLLSGSLLSALLLVFVDILKELPATLVLRPFNFNTLAVRAYELASDERLIDAALPAISIVLVALIPVMLLTHQMTKQSDRSSHKVRPTQPNDTNKGRSVKYA